MIRECGTCVFREGKRERKGWDWRRGGGGGRHKGMRRLREEGQEGEGDKKEKGGEWGRRSDMGKGGMR